MRKQKGILTTTQKVVLKYLLAGVSSEETCSILRIKYKTLETHKSNIYRRSGITGGVNVAKLFNWALANGLYDPESITIQANPEKAKPSIYLIQEPSTGLIKIGYSARVQERMKHIQYVECPDSKLILLDTFPGTYAIERLLHKRYGSCRLSGEWFALTDAQVAEIRLFMKSEMLRLAIELSERL